MSPYISARSFACPFPITALFHVVPRTITRETLLSIESGTTRNNLAAKQAAAHRCPRRVARKEVEVGLPAVASPFPAQAGVAFAVAVEVDVPPSLLARLKSISTTPTTKNGALECWSAGLFDGKCPLLILLEPPQNQSDPAVEAGEA